jgi:DNA-directed RNA polymerase specialized sigma24 family protein
MKYKYDNAERLEGVSDKEWREALDEVTAYLHWRLAGKTKRGAHSEQELGMPALDYYQEEAVVKLIEGEWKWQERFSLGRQLVIIAGDLVTKQVKKWEREHPWLAEDGRPKDEEGIPQRKPEVVEFTDDIDQFGDVLDGDNQEELDETYDVVYSLVEDDEELTIFVGAIEHCGNFKDLPEHTGWEMKHVYRLMEKLMRRIKSAKRKGLL